jgi:histidyl-tRNA synthetase
MNKKFAMIAGIATVVGITAFGTITMNSVSAATTYPAGIQKIADTFNLDASKVMQAFEQGKEEQFTSRLTTLVSEKKITEEQKNKIIELHNKIDAKRDELVAANTDRDDMREQMKSLHDEMKSYLESQNLDDIVGLGGPGKGRGPGRN